MTNAEKFKAAEVRAKEFGKWCEKNKIFDSHGNTACAWRCVFCTFAWLDREAEDDEPLPCPFCGNNSVLIVNDKSSPMPWSVKCSCGYSSERTPDKELTIAAHNRVARAVMEAGKKEETP